MQQQGITGLVEDAFGRGAAAAQAQVQPQVEGAEGQALDAFAAGDLRQRQQPRCTLDDRPHRLAAGRHTRHLRSTFHLGQQHADDTGMTAAQFDIGAMAGMLWRVDAHQQASLWIGGEKAIEMGAGLDLEALLHGVFQVDDDRVGTDGERLGDALRAARRHEQGAANDL